MSRIWPSARAAYVTRGSWRSGIIRWPLGILISIIFFSPAALAQSFPPQFANALQKAQYSVVAGDVNGDGAVDLMLVPKKRIVIIDYDVAIPVAQPSSFRADITGLGLVQDGVNALTIEGLSFTAASNGAGVLVIYDDGSSNAQIAVRDGSDLAFFQFAPPLDGTVPQTFTFAASNDDRTASISMLFASVAGTTSGGALRPTTIELTTNGTGEPNKTVLHNVLDSSMARSGTPSPSRWTFLREPLR